MRKSFFIPILLLLFVHAVPCLARSAVSRIFADIPSRSGKSVFQEIYYEADSSTTVDLYLSCFKINPGSDSLLVYRKAGQTRLKKGISTLRLAITGAADSAWILPDLKEILLKTGSFPAGAYHLYIQFANAADTSVHSFLMLADSSIGQQSESRNALNDIYHPEKKATIAGISLTGSSNANKGSAASILEKTSRQVGKAFKSKGLTITHRREAGFDYTDIWYKSWFVGYYRTDLSKSLSASIDRERKQLQENIASLAGNELDGMQSLSGQVKKLKSSDKDKEVKGELGVSATGSTGQEEYSEQDNNYYELYGKVEMPVMNIPVSLEGYYTSQDKHRKLKASYLKLHYDTEAAKSELMKLVSGYREKYDQTASKGKNLDGIYKPYLEKIASEKSGLISDLKKQSGLTDIPLTGLDTAALRAQLTQRLESAIRDSLAARKDSSALANKQTRLLHTKDSVTRLYNGAVEKYRRLQQLEQTYNKYSKLLDQYRNCSYLDSAMTYADVKDLDDMDAMSYKQLAKKASDLLPDGKAKSFVTGLTNLDAGIFSKELSSYTLAGQNIKGIDAGYDLGFCETGFTYGRVEYAARDGNVDKYTGYSGRVSFKPGKNQKASVIYYGYTPSRRMLADEQFFKDVDASLPSFTSPVHIVSATYTGTVKKMVNIDAEAASSFRKVQDQTTDSSMASSFHDKMAWRIALDGDIPNTGVTLNAGYEHSGKSFENNSLPVSMSGTDRLKLGAKGIFFKNFLTLGIEYNYLLQQSMFHTGGNTKWGFEIKTNSKRYPSVGLSYKPFSSFRSLADTLNVPQRPLIGAVWTGKASYQIKKKDYAIRLMVVYNKNTSQMDTVDYSSSLFQFSAIYTRGKAMGMITLGSASAKGTEQPAAHGNTKNLGLNGSLSAGNGWSLNAGQDFGLAKFGFSRYGASLGTGYRFKKTPLTVRAGIRYTTYKLESGQSWKQVLGGTIDLGWEFRFKMKE